MSTRRILALVGGLIIVMALVVGAFCLGLRVGEMRSASFQGGDVPGRLSGLAGTPPPPPWLAGHGILGRVESVDSQGRVLSVLNEDGARCLVLAGEDAVVERDHQRIYISQIKVGERIVIIGRPAGQGRIIARAVRVLGNYEPNSPWAMLANLVYRIYRAINLPWRWLWRRV